MLKHRGDLSIERVNEGLSIVVSFPLYMQYRVNILSEVSIIRRSSASLIFFNKVLPQPFSGDVLRSNLFALSNEVNSCSLDVNATLDYADGTLNVLDRTYRILVVDDSAMVRKMTVKLMNSLGHSCEEADDGDTAVEVVRSRPSFDVILMDNQMPRMTGEEATEVIRRDLNFQGIILGVTGNALDDDIQRFASRGADEVIIKPMARSHFVEAMNRVTKKTSLDP